MLDASDSSDPDGDALHYTWQWDGTAVGSDLPFLEYKPSETNLGYHTVDCFISDGYVMESRRWNVRLVAKAVEMAAMAASFSFCTLSRARAASFSWAGVPDICSPLATDKYLLLMAHGMLACFDRAPGTTPGLDADPREPRENLPLAGRKARGGIVEGRRS